MKKRQWMKSKRFISLVLACLLVVSIIPWGDLVVRAEEEAFSITLQEEGGIGVVSDISIKEPQQVSPEDGSLADGKISGIPAGAKVTFHVAPEAGKYLLAVVH